MFGNKIVTGLTFGAKSNIKEYISVTLELQRGRKRAQFAIMAETVKGGLDFKTFLMLFQHKYKIISRILIIVEYVIWSKINNT